MAAATALSALARAVRESGLIAEGTRGVVLVSGGADSAATAAGLVEVLGPGAVTALHLNYGLRPDSDRDEETVRELCARLGIELEVERPELGGGNVQAAAREARYHAAERLRRARGARLDRHRAHPHGSRRDGALPARDLAGAPGAARAAGRGGARSSDRCSGSAATRCGGWRRTPACHSATTRRTLEPLYRPQPDPERGPARAARDRPEPRRRSPRPRRSSPRRARRSSGPPPRPSPESGAEPAGAISRDALARSTRRCAGWLFAAGGASRRPAVPLGRARAEEIWRLVNEPEGGVVELGGGVEAQVEAGTRALHDGSCRRARRGRR